MVGISDQQLTTAHSLEVALVTEIGVASGEQLRVDRAVGGMADGTAFADCLVFKNMRSSLCRMAAQAALVLREQGGSSAEVYGTFVRRMAIHTAQLRFGQGMMTGKAELSPNIGMALEADGIFGSRVGQGHRGPKAVGGRPTGREAVGCLDLAPGFSVQAGRAVAGFASDIQGVGPWCHQAGMIGSADEASVNVLVALLALFGAYEGGTRNHGELHYSPVDG